MPRLFTALWPPPEAVAALEAELAAAPDWPPDGWRATPSGSWHLTLCFHGNAETGPLARSLEADAGGLTAPVLRLAGAVSFPGVAAVRVVPRQRGDAEALDALVRAAGDDPAKFRAHVTVARTSRRRDAPPARGPLAGHQGPWWEPAEVCLVRSELGAGPPRYTVVHRVPLPGGARQVPE